MLNRSELFARLQARIDAAMSAGESFGLLVIRTQRLREFNLLFGYETGDRIAETMQSEIVAALRPVDEMHRIGECDFAVLVPGLRNRQHLALAAAKLVRVLQAPLDTGGQELQVSVAIGGAVCPEDGRDADLLCRLADSASDEAANGSDRFALYETPEFSETFAHSDLRDAIVANQLHLFLQPIASLQGAHCARTEALSRWNHPELGAIPPDAFIRVAEQTGLIGDLTRWSLNVAMRHTANAHAEGCPLAVSVNVSPWALQQSGFVEQMRDLPRIWNVAPSDLVLEITESGLMRDLQHCGRLLRQLRDEGFGIAIDDFGTGYSSMAYLKRLPATELKIDRSFIVDLTQDARTDKLVGSMIDLSHHLGIEVVAEGVEDEATLQRLREMGCDFAQGYHIGRPAPAGDVVARLLAGDD